MSPPSLVRPHWVETSWEALVRSVEEGEESSLASSASLFSASQRRRRRHETLRYAWERCRCGVFVRVNGGKLCAFVPFANTAFQNSWGLRSLLPSPEDDWPEEAQSRNGALPPENWWCNAGILCTRPGRNAWSTELFGEFAHFISQAARLIPHVHGIEFMLNKRDFPNVRKDGADPYGATFFGLGQRVVGSLLLPFFSCFVGSAFADELVPLAQDHHAADGQNQWAAGASGAFRQDWSKRRPCAVFRGTATGCGTTAETNPRIRIAQLCQEHADYFDYFDVCLTGVNGRIRKHPLESRLRVLGPDDVAVSPGAWMSLEQQAQKYRFALCIEGHSAPGRLADLLRLGFLVFWIDTVSAPADETHCYRAARAAGCLVRVSVEDLLEAVRAWAADEEGSARLAWRGVRFHAEHLTASALERALADTMERHGNVVEPRRKKRRRQPLGSEAPGAHLVQSHPQIPVGLRQLNRSIV